MSRVFESHAEVVQPAPSGVDTKEAANKTKLRAYLKEYKRRKRREVLPGYPLPAGPLPKDVIDDYLHSVDITCLLCGKPYRGLAYHLLAIHSTNVDEYREMYGLPYRQGLTCEELKEWNSERGSRPEHIARLNAIRETAPAPDMSKMRRSAYKDFTSLENIAKAPKQAREYTAEHAWPIIELISGGMSLSRALAATPSGPRKSAFLKLVRDYPEVDEAYRRAKAYAILMGN